MNIEFVYGMATALFAIGIGWHLRGLKPCAVCDRSFDRYIKERAALDARQPPAG